MLCSAGPIEEIHDVVVRVLDGTPASDSDFLLTTERCHVCGCTPESPCSLANGDACNWINYDHTLCSNPNCLRQALRSNAKSTLRPVTPGRRR